MSDQVEDVVNQTPAKQNSEADNPAPAAETPVTTTQTTQPVASTSEPTAKDAPANAEKVDPAPTEKKPEPEPVATASLELVIFDDKNQPIPKMALRVIDVLQTNVRKKVLFDGATDSKGRVPLIENLSIGTRFEIQIRRDTGEYRFSACGTIDVAAEHTANLLIPRQRFEFSTSTHQGAPGLAEDKVKDLVKKHNQAPEEKPNISRNPPEKKPEIAVDRNKDGNPVVIVKDGQKNMLGTNAAKVPFVNAGKTDVEKVKALIEFAMEQIKWIHPDDLVSSTIIGRMWDSSYQVEKRDSGSGYKKTLKRCNKYVKIALAMSGYSPNGNDIAPKISPARLMGPALEAAGFSNITSSLPDARWAAPGDIIVYDDKKGATNAGHIDIRTYDGYVSDFFETYLPVTGFVVTGIYRKYSDPLPVKRMKAFLKVIRSREAETVLAKHGDEATYKALPLSAKKGLMFDSFSTHPFANTGSQDGPSGAYGIKCLTWKDYVSMRKLVPVAGGDMFSPTIQDRIAVAIMEFKPAHNFDDNKGVNALGLIRLGKIEQAIPILTRTWTSLPGGAESRAFSMAQFLAAYEKNLSEMQ